MRGNDYAASLELLRLIADGEVHSGAVIAEKLGVSRAAVWKRVKRLVDLELCVTTIHARGYRLPRPLELLDLKKIESALPGNLPSDSQRSRSFPRSTQPTKNSCGAFGLERCPRGLCCLPNNRRRGVVVGDDPG